ncbi:aspartyl-tRNA(Asn)/glutamyl-tRNA(Gln) amidotransferase subunit A [Singulisphaera sp. GP187]|uniref:amidase n=1 Tax=Singulisphaera sp. GP187 TaxID=1882752 RepID=UPI00092654E7|nr:amidase [Singulisphaera sp. GP187]SIO07276.1 aspartyl-tRNA(Asn)/glutamyl-tRNA(Gln) amidotransferase subunit A [Singulisphaera sp. GP187]
MGLFPNEHETIDGVGRALRSGRRSCVEVLEQCLDRIAEWEPRIKAWVTVDRNGALEQARLLDEELRSGRCRGALHGIPIGVKDIIDVAGMPTAAGFRPWSGRVAGNDAGIVASLRTAGAVILGKTVTTQFAWIDPPVTRNPWNLERTPGGSSSGSAAAVAAGMCLGALGTQTGGSIIRPSSFCGVAGLKPTFTGPMDGIVPFAPHLDHPGPIARSVRDLGLIFMEFFRLEEAVTPPLSGCDEVENLLAKTFAPLTRPPRLGRLRGPFENRADAVMRAAFDRAVDALKAAGAEVTDVADLFDFDEVTRNHRLIMAAEAAAEHAGRLAGNPADYKPMIRALIEEGNAITATAYIEARRHQEELRANLFTRADGFDALVTPATLGAAPDPSTTGSPAFNSPWSFTGAPALSFPIDLSPDGMPLALQLVEPRLLRECDLFETAQWCEDVVRSAFRRRGN